MSYHYHYITLRWLCQLSQPWHVLCSPSTSSSVKALSPRWVLIPLPSNIRSIASCFDESRKLFCIVRPADIAASLACNITILLSHINMLITVDRLSNQSRQCIIHTLFVRHLKGNIPVNPLTPQCCHTSTAIKHSVPDRVKLSFVIFDIRALLDGQQWVSECPDVKNYRGQLNPVWHKMLYSCTHMATMSIKALNNLFLTT